jgi:hypothetical protein
MQELDTEKEHSNNDILRLHAQDCILADTLFDLMNNPTDIYTMTDRSRSRSSISSPLPLSPVKSTRECISSIGAAANSPVPSPSSSSDVPMEASPSTPHLPSNYPLSPALIRSCGCPTSVNLTYSNPERPASSVPKTTIIKQSATYKPSYKFGAIDTTPILAFILSCPVNP